MLSNNETLSPVRFLDRAATAFGERTAVIDGDRSFTYAELAGRAAALTGVLAGRGISPGDRVAALCTNSHVMLELHFGVPMRGAVLVSLNIRLSEPELAYILMHSGATLLVATEEFAELAARLSTKLDVPLLRADGADSDYERELDAAEPRLVAVDDERALLAINYTSGTTGRPKGVMYHHRGAYLQSLAMAYQVGLGPGSTYLWTLPMFHCNGWCFPWAVTAAGGTHVALRAVDPQEIWQRLRGGVTHFSAAPAVLTMVAEHASAGDGPLTQPVAVSAGGAPPSPTLLGRLEALNMSVTHLYGLTETFGPVMVNQWQPEWDALDEQARATLKARQGVPNVLASSARVVDVDGRDIEPDGQSVGELVIRGNNLMLGYYRDEVATAAASLDGWFRTGDLAALHPDGYVEIRDRLKDVIISGGENIASVEIEQVLDSHPAIVESAVVGMPDERWGEVPVAFVTTRVGVSLTEAEVIEFVRERLARFKAPKRVEFLRLPRTSTGKIQKNLLRAKVQDGAGHADA
ncbi:MAG: putative AMP-binding acyl-CoA synthetase [Marmoricola sp.]|nr:putative AMP-binding acyl-CoA synthetase [Marmoricola sp.]MCW2821290.1 putative AMP-binding acyl-CoA synthetase [Marmoricola sp.]